MLVLMMNIVWPGCKRARSWRPIYAVSRVASPETLAPTAISLSIQNISIRSRAHTPIDTTTMPHAESPASSPPVADDTIISEAPVLDPASSQGEDEQTTDASQPAKANLDDMFDDENDDDEFSSSAQTKPEGSSQPRP